MNFTGIGIQQILARAATSWKGRNPSRQQDSAETDRDVRNKPEHAATDPGVGKVVDKIA